MISRENAQVFGIVPNDVKMRIKRITKRSREWSESKIIKEALLRILPEIEGQNSPNHDSPRRKNSAA